jgi:ABC-2 type transport system ATP-binding protein
MGHATPALEARGLVKRYKDLTAVAGVDLKVGRGECLALLGPNGAGKTTTVEMLEGLLAPDAGQVLILGESLAQNRRGLLEKVGVLLQETNLYKRYTVRETLELFASFYEKSLDPEAIMTRLGLTDKADVQLRRLSGGQKQRVYLGAALINDPDLLFLDEPTTGLDPQARRAIWDLVQAIKAEGKSILLTTHYMEEAEVLADRVAIMDQGKIIVEGTPRELIDSIGAVQVVRNGTLEDVFLKMTGRSIRDA